MKPLLFCLLFLFSCYSGNAQQASISGYVTIDGKAAEGIYVQHLALRKGAFTNEKGYFELNGLNWGKNHLFIQHIGYDDVDLWVVLDSLASKKILQITLSRKLNNLSEIVVTGTKTFKRRTESPVIVNVLDSKTLTQLQVCNLSEGLKFQPGLRVETDCQTCNYTQLRMNGLAGGYSQILINGRPVFSPLMGLYGMEQLPVNMIDRIEVVRGGGSSLYGSSAIGGTVNVITRIPQKNEYELNSFYQRIGNETNDYTLNGNASFVNKNKNAGASLFFSHRNRGDFDSNQDNFSELPMIENISFGTQLFYTPTLNQKIEIACSALNEYRYGGEMAEKPAHLALQSEERTHRVVIGNIDYQLNFNENKSSFIAYTAAQQTNRKHYTGIFPDDSVEISQHLALPPYGLSSAVTYQAGLQLNHRVEKFLKGKNTFTVGTEYLSDDIQDEIKAYGYKVDQRTIDWGTFLQSDWEIIPSLDLLSGIRMDWHNRLKNLVYSPRLALLYKYGKNVQFRFGYGQGFRAPQAFDTDLHVAFAAGGVSRVQLSKTLKEERSNSWSLSCNMDFPKEEYIYGFTLEGFYTHLKDAFILSHIGNDSVGEVFEKRNGKGAFVNGITIEGRVNYKKKVQLETGFTLQQSQFDETVEYIQGLESGKSFLRTPNEYGFANLNWKPTGRWNLNINYVFTGSMKLAHFGGAVNFPSDSLISTRSFSELNGKVAYVFNFSENRSALEFYVSLKNILNAYQSDFDKGKNRDSNYIYGPAIPRSIGIGIKWSRG